MSRPAPAPVAAWQPSDMASARAGQAALGLFLLSLLSVAVAAPALAQEDSEPSIAIIDMQRILRESVAVQSMQQELDRLRGQYQAELQKKEEEFRNTDQELLRQRSVLTAEVYAKRRQELEREVAEMQREIQQRRRGLDEIFGQGMNQVRLELIGIVKEIASDRGADLVLAKANVVLVRPDLEITDEALERLNASLKTLPLTPAQN